MNKMVMNKIAMMAAVLFLVACSEQDPAMEPDVAVQKQGEESVELTSESSTQEEEVSSEEPVAEPVSDELSLVDNPVLSEETAVIKTNLGNMVVKFYDQDAPLTVAHFKHFVAQGWYSDRSFYRVVRDFVIQGGDGKDRNDELTVEGEFKAKHLKGVISLARDADPDTASTEFFICLADLPRLDGKYAAFGEVVEGIEVLESIGGVELVEKYVDYEGKSIAFHSPAEKVVIESIEIRKP